MRMRNIKYFVIVLILLSCIVGAVSAADDISQDAICAADDVVITDQIEEANTDVFSTGETVSIDSQSDTSLELSNAEEENLRTSDTVTVSNWNELAGNASESGIDHTINLNGPITINSSDILFGNNAIVVGNDNSYITGNANGRIPFKSDNAALSITFRNVKFQNINCQMLIQLETSGISILDNCTFINITAGTGHDSVVYNNNGTMNMTNCTFINCTAGFGAVTNHRAGTTTGVTLNVKDSKFENNSASTEPGAINNCGILKVYNCTFIKNNSTKWAGAIHTHSNANTLINQSVFKGNYAKENGGALFTYSVLKIYNSLFEDNICNTSTGGGAIGSYNYLSRYDIYINNCTFKNNKNNNTADGHGGAITALNNGYLNVYNSTFINNNATIGQAICGFNQHYENGSGGKPYLKIEGCNFTNHTGTSDTVYVSGYINAFNNNHFVNSTQNTHFPGSGNTYALINPIRSDSKGVLGSSSNDVLSVDPAAEIYINISSSNDPGDVTGESWEQAVGGEYGFYYAAMNIYDLDEYSEGLSKLHIAEGNYSSWLQWYPGKYCHVIGYGDVMFSPEDGYDLDFGSQDDYCYEPTFFIKETSKVLFIHENIIFDCDVKVGSKNFKFINCTFKKGLTISHDYQYHNEFTPGDSEHFSDTFNITFEGCTFENPKSDIAIVEDKNIVMFDDNCKFPITAVDSVIDISSPKKGTIVITLTDNSTAPIAGAIVKYAINGGEEQTNTTGEDGKFTITGLSGEVTIAVSYEGNESFNSISGNKFFNFTEEPATNDTNGSNSTPVAPTKVATKLTAPKVTATYNVAKKLVITLKDAKGKVLANKKVTVKVGTISKTLKTNSKGQVSVNVATLVPKTYTASIKFAGDSSYKASSVTAKVAVAKAKPKLAAAKKTFKRTAKTKKVTATLKNNKGKVLKKVKLTLKVGKKTYTAKTNKKGVATFKVKLTKKGTYTGTVKFAGNKYFKALSKKVKIVIKK